MPVSFANMDQTNVMIALFLLMVTIVCVNPTMVKKLNNTVLGRIILVAIIVYFAVHNTTAGILAGLVVICAMQTYIYQEGFDGAVAGNAPGSTATATATAPVQAQATGLEQESKIDQTKVDELKKKLAEASSTPDQLATQQQMQPVSSNTIQQPPPTGNGDDVAPAVKETFQTLAYSAY
jgi:hypothetical protein